LSTFLCKKTFIENYIKKIEKHYCNHRSLDFIMKVAGCRAYYVSQCLYRHGCCDVMQ